LEPSGQGQSQLKTNFGAPSIKYKEIKSVVEEIYGKFEVNITLSMQF